MRVGIFTDAYVPQIGGVSTVSQLIKNELNRRGHTAYVITTTDKAAVEEENVIRYPSIPFVSEKRIGLNISPELNREIKGLHLDLVHTQTEYTMGKVGKDLAEEQGIPYIHTFHTLYDIWMRGQLGENFFSESVITMMNWLLKQHLRGSKAIIAPSQKTADFLESYDLDIPVHILPSGIAVQSFQEARANQARQAEIRRELGIPSEAFVAIYVGRISEEKSIDLVLGYLAPLVREQKDLYFVAVGSGPRLEDYREQVESWGLGKQIQFIGQVPVDHVKNFYAIGDIFACASQSETQGLTYIEAMAAGLPLLVRPDPCLEGVLEVGKNGLGFTNREEFVAGLSQLKSQEGLRREMSAAAQKKSKEFSVESFMDKLLAIYESVLS